jgi:hypothetical protein
MWEPSMDPIHAYQECGGQKHRGLQAKLQTHPVRYRRPSTNQYCSSAGTSWCSKFVFDKESSLRQPQICDYCTSSAFSFQLVTAKLSISAQPSEVVDKIRTHPLNLRAFPVLSVSTLAVLRSTCPSPTPSGRPQLSLTQTRRPQLLSSAKPIRSLR